MDKLRDLFHYICENWNDLKGKQKEILKEQIFKTTRLCLMGRSAGEKKKKRRLVFDLVTQVFEDHSLPAQKDNLTGFVIESGFFSQLLFRPEKIYDYPYPVNNKAFLRFYNLTADCSYETSVGIFGQLLSCLKKDAQIFLLEKLKEKKSALSYAGMVDALFSGMIRYDEETGLMLCQRIESLPADELIPAGKNNPVYILSALYVYGYIDEYELKRFEVYLSKAPMLKLCLHPQDFDWDTPLPKGWDEIVLDRRILKMKDRHFFCI
jgi:hypothetical protein